MKKKTNYSRFLLLWAGSLISQVGGGLTSFGLGVYIFNRTGSAAQMALVTLLGFLPTLLLSVPAGVLADLFDRRLLMMIGDGCSAIGIIYILLCMNSGGAFPGLVQCGLKESGVHGLHQEAAQIGGAKENLLHVFLRVSGHIN